MRRNLVIVRARATSQHERWMSGPGDRNWDLIVGYDGEDPDRFLDPDVVRVHAGGPKWPALHRLVKDMAEVIEQYDYVWLPDDDIDTEMTSINAMFDICAEYELSLSQPAASGDSYVNHQITRAAPGQVLRYTNYVEIVAPCFSREFLSRCAPDFAATLSGLGLESWWPTMLGESDIAIIDAVTIRQFHKLPTRKHSGIPESRRTHASVEQDLRAAEYERYLAEKGIDPVEPQVHRSVPIDQEAEPPYTVADETHREPFWTGYDNRRELDPSRCVILVPVADSIEPDCARSLFELEQLGYPVWRVYGATAIDQVRSQMATDALAAGFEELMWIDADITFPVDAVERLRRHNLPISCAIYPKKGQRELVIHLQPGTTRLTFGEGGGLAQIKYAATGFLLTQRQVYERIQVQEKLPTCNVQLGRPIVPYFLPMAVPVNENFWYLGEDFAFCERARRSGFRIMADTRIRLGHIGRQTFEWEDAGSSRERFGTFTFNF